MKKYMEENPFNEDREEDIRINEGDTSPKLGKKNFKGFEELENMPDPDAQAEVEGGKFIEEDEGESNEFFEDDETERINQLKQDIYFHSSDGVVSVGPDVDGEQLEDYKTGESLDIRQVQVSPERESVNVKNATNIDRENRKNKEYKKSQENTGEEKDNLKTLQKKKDKDGNKSWIPKKVKNFLRNFMHFGQEDKYVSPDEKNEKILDGLEIQKEENEHRIAKMGEEFEQESKHDKAA